MAKQIQYAQHSQYMQYALKLSLFLTGVMMFLASSSSAAAQTESITWAQFIESGKPFVVNFDVASFDDEGWKDDKDPMGTLKAGEKYTVTYTASSQNWTVAGYNERTKGKFSTSYKRYKPTDGYLNLWGRVYTFKESGAVLDKDYGFVGHLEGKTKGSITYPITELGNCPNESECKSYCSKSENIIACTNFGEANGLLTPAEAKKAKEFADVLKGESPGACKDEASCKSYCDDIAHASECASFAERHNLISKQELTQLKQLAKALDAGASMPGGCKNKDSCEAYCASDTNIEECLSFAEASGMLSGKELAEAKKVLPYLKAGQTPGKCKNKAECENYCAQDDKVPECVDFAEKAGLITPEDAAIVRKTGGVGPGGCRSRDACATYCNGPDHQQECFEFASKHGLLRPEELKEIKEGTARLRVGLSQMPPEAVACLRRELGDEAVDQIAAGTYVPNKSVSDKVNNCISKSLGQIKQKLEEGFKLSPEAKQCVQNKLGVGGLEQLLQGKINDPAVGDSIKGCFASAKAAGLKKLQAELPNIPPGGLACVEQALGADVVRKIEAGEDVEIGPDAATAMQKCAETAKTQILDQFKQALQQIPPEMQDCVRGKLTPAVMKKVEAGEYREDKIRDLINQCVSAMIPKDIPGGPPAGIPGMQGIPSIPNIPGASTVPPRGIPSIPRIPEGIPTGPPVGMPAIPAVPSVPPSAIPAVPPSGTQGAPSDEAMCQGFAAAPSCDYVPPQFQEICRKCKSR